VNICPYHLAEKHKKEVNRQIEKMLDEGIIRSSTTQWNASILVVPKKRDALGKQKLRIVVDFTRLNDSMIGDSYQLLNILDQLANAKYFSTLDLASGYHQMNEKDKNKSVLYTYRHYGFNRMPFGLKNVPAIFQFQIDERHIMALADQRDERRDTRYAISSEYSLSGIAVCSLDITRRVSRRASH